MKSTRGNLYPKRLTDFKLIMLDLNVAFTTNFDRNKMMNGMNEWITQHEEYRGWLADLIMASGVPCALVTHRAERHKKLTVESIHRKTSLRASYYFRDQAKERLGPPAMKVNTLRFEIIPEMEILPSEVLCIESNHQSRKALKLLGCWILDAPRSDPWGKIPFRRADHITLKKTHSQRSLL